MIDDPADGLPARVVRAHSADKAYYGRRYAAIVGTGMKFKWPGKRWWIETFSGPGRLYVAGEDRFTDGSPLEAVNIKDRFDGYVFADLDGKCTSALDARLANVPNAYVLRGDANDLAFLDQIAAIVPRNSLVVYYGDPQGLDLSWPAINYFMRLYRHLDLLLNLPIDAAVRALAAGHEGKASTVLNHPHPAELLEHAPANRSVPVREWYWRTLSGHGYRYIDCVPIRGSTTNAPIYDLMLASGNPKALEFFHKITGIAPGGQRPLFQAG